jgi:hypothetical protein
MEVKRMIIDRGRGFDFNWVISQYTFKHTDIAPNRKAAKLYKCRECLFSSEHLKTTIRHYLRRHLGRRTIFTHEYARIISNGLWESYATEEQGFLHLSQRKIEEGVQVLDEVLDKYHLHAYDVKGEVELLSDDLEYLKSLVRLGSVEEIVLSSGVDKTIQGLVETLEDFENRVGEAYTKYLGLPKESVM